jgi:HD-like signal output (HDOD) protein
LNTTGLAMSSTSLPSGSATAEGSPYSDVNVGYWLSRFDASDLPVLASTVATLEQLRGIEDAVDAHLLADQLGEDPLMCLKVLRELSRVRQGRDAARIDTMTEALVMLGITPFFRAFGRQPEAEQLLHDDAHRLLRLDKAVRCGRQAAHLAMAFAAQRNDTDATAMHQTALLHNFAELLMLTHSGPLAPSRITALPSHEGERGRKPGAARVVPAPDLVTQLVANWQLPRMLLHLDDAPDQSPSHLRCVQLAIAIANHQRHDETWRDQDVDAVARLLGMTSQAAGCFLADLDS